jgi:hypothetical protein
MITVAAVAKLISSRGPQTTWTVAKALAGQPPAHVDGRTREGRAWQLALASAAEALARLGCTGQVVRVRTRSGVWFMTTEDAEALLAEAQEGLEARKWLAQGMAASP